MYAVIRASGRQYKVEPGTVLEMDRLAGNPGETVTLEDAVLLVSNDGNLQVGNPALAGAKVELEILSHLRGDKIVAFKMKRRKRSRVKKGHRQELTKVTVRDIKLG